MIIFPIYNGDTQESEVRVVDINTFEILHVYKHDVQSMNKNIENSNQDFYENDKFNSKQRFLYIHPLILSDGSLISSGVDGVLFKIDLCSNIVWINQEDRFHHSKNLTADNNIWAITSMYPYSELISKQFKNYGLGFRDDAITKISNDGKLIYTQIHIRNTFTKQSYWG